MFPTSLAINCLSTTERKEQCSVPTKLHRTFQLDLDCTSVRESGTRQGGH
jgi:hypothetical protein